MKRLCGILTLLLATVPVGSVGRSEAADRQSCSRPADSELFGTSSRLKLYLRGAVFYVACDRRTGRKRRLNIAEAAYSEAPADAALNGRYAAFPILVEEGGPEIKYLMRVVDATRRGRGVDVPMYTRSEVPHEGGELQPSDLDLSRGGDVSWIIVADGPALREVRYRPQGGEAA